MVVDPPARHATGLPLPEPFGVTADGERVHRFLLIGRQVEMAILTYGGVVQSLVVPDARGHRANIVLGFSSLSGYQGAGSAYFGAIIGRYANRIGGATYELDGQRVSLTANDGRNHLHGGDSGFDKQVWRARTEHRSDGVALTLWRTSQDGEEGHRGTVEVEVSYVLADDDAVRIEYRAATTHDTIISLTNHALFNLAGEGRGTILGHELQVDAETYTEIDSELVPTGRIVSVEGTPLDFRRPTKIGARIGSEHAQLRVAGGYDHNFVLRTREQAVALRRAARLVDPISGRELRVSTTEPGLQVYTGNRLDGSLVGASGRRYDRFAGVALETQRYPDSPNRPDFPSAVLRRGELFRSVTELRFGSARR